MTGIIEQTDKAGSKDLLQVYDDFVELCDHCSFMCEAFSCLAAQGSEVDRSTAMGMSYYSHWIKQTMQRLKCNLKTLLDETG